MEDNIDIRIEKSKTEYKGVTCWSLNEIMNILDIDSLSEYRKALFNAMSKCVYNNINYAEHFKVMTCDVMITDYGLNCYLQELPYNNEKAHEALDFFKMYQPKSKFPDADPSANDYFLFPDDKVRFLHEVGNSKGLTECICIVQFHMPNDLAVYIGNQQVFCKRSDLELVERKKK